METADNYDYDQAIGGSGPEMISYECDQCGQLIQTGSEHKPDCPLNPENREVVICKGCGESIEKVGDHKSSCPFSLQGFGYNAEMLERFGEGTKVKLRDVGKNTNPNAIGEINESRTFELDDDTVAETGGPTPHTPLNNDVYVGEITPEDFEDFEQHNKK